MSPILKPVDRPESRSPRCRRRPKAGTQPSACSAAVSVLSISTGGGYLVGLGHAALADGAARQPAFAGADQMEAVS